MPDVIGMVKKDELIVDANERVSRDAVLKLRSLRNLEMARRGRSDFLYPPVARMLLMLLFILAFVGYMRMELPGVARDNAMLAKAARRERRAFVGLARLLHRALLETRPADLALRALMAMARGRSILSREGDAG